MPTQFSRLRLEVLSVTRHSNSVLTAAARRIKLAANLQTSIFKDNPSPAFRSASPRRRWWGFPKESAHSYACSFARQREQVKTRGAESYFIGVGWGVCEISNSSPFTGVSRTTPTPGA